MFLIFNCRLGTKVLVLLKSVVWIKNRWSVFQPFMKIPEHVCLDQSSVGVCVWNTSLRHLCFLVCLIVVLSLSHRALTKCRSCTSLSCWNWDLQTSSSCVRLRAGDFPSRLSLSKHTLIQRMEDQFFFASSEQSRCAQVPRDWANGRIC